MKLPFNTGCAFLYRTPIRTMDGFRFPMSLAPPPASRPSGSPIPQPGFPRTQATMSNSAQITGNIANLGKTSYLPVDEQGLGKHADWTAFSEACQSEITVVTGRLACPSGPGDLGVRSNQSLGMRSHAFCPKNARISKCSPCFNFRQSNRSRSGPANLTSGQTSHFSRIRRMIGS